MNRQEYRRTHSAGRCLVRLINELEIVGDVLSAGTLAQRSAIHYYRHEYMSAACGQLTPAQVCSHRPYVARPPLYRLSAEARARLHTDAVLRRCGVPSRVGPLPLPR